jgi:hypothetical protein
MLNAAIEWFVACDCDGIDRGYEEGDGDRHLVEVARDERHGQVADHKYYKWRQGDQTLQS